MVLLAAVLPLRWSHTISETARTSDGNRVEAADRPKVEIRMVLIHIDMDGEMYVQIGMILG